MSFRGHVNRRISHYILFNTFDIKSIKWVCKRFYLHITNVCSVCVVHSTTTTLTCLVSMLIYKFLHRRRNNGAWGERAPFFTARRCASAVLAVIVCPSVRPSVRLSVTSRSCTKTAKPRIRLTTPYDSPETLVLRCQKSWRNSHDITPNGGAK